MTGMRNVCVAYSWPAGERRIEWYVLDLSQYPGLPGVDDALAAELALSAACYRAGVFAHPPRGIEVEIMDAAGMRVTARTGARWHHLLSVFVHPTGIVRIDPKPDGVELRPLALAGGGV